MNKRKQTIIALIILILSVVMIVASVYYKQNYKEQTFDTIVYHLVRGPEKANTEVVGIALKVCIIPIILLTTILMIPITNFKRKIKIRKLQLYPIDRVVNNKIKYSVVILLVSIIFALGQIGLYTYIVNQLKRSEIFEEEYVANNKLAGVREIDNLESSTTYLWPVDGYYNLSSPYGWRNCPYHGREYHSGIDIPAPSGTPVKAAKNATVISSGWNGGYGNCVVLQHSDGGKTLYAHLRYINVTVNQEVSQGDVIGGVGTTGNSTGNHLHYEVWTGSNSDTRVNPMNYY